MEMEERLQKSNVIFKVYLASFVVLPFYLSDAYFRVNT